MTAALLLALALATTAPRLPGDGDARVERRVSAMGTLLSIEVEHATRAQALAASEAALRALEAVEARLSNWRADSELSRLNRTPPGELFRPGPELARDLATCRELFAETAGRFDPGVGALVRAGGHQGAPADPAALERARGATLADLEWSAAGVRRRSARVEIDSGGFGKGVGLDEALAALRAAGAHAAALDLGGQVALLEGAPRALGLAHPRERARVVAELELESGSLATSGTSERGAHLLDPATGRPPRDFGSLSVWSSSAVRADALSTALFVMGPDAALEWAGAHPDVEAVVLEERDGRITVRATAGLRGRLRVLAADATPQNETGGRTR